MPNQKTKRAAKGPDAVLAGCVEQARAALAPVANPDEIGAHLEVRDEGQRLASHYFECLKKGYRGWRWVATLARSPRARSATVCEISLLPGPDSLLAPPWVPWSERLAREQAKADKCTDSAESDALVHDGDEDGPAADATAADSRGD